MTIGTPELITSGAAFLLLIVLATMLRETRAREVIRAAPDFQDVFIGIVDGTYDPPGIVLKRGIPAKLRIHRDGEAGEEFVVEGLSTTRKLPIHKTTTIDISPDRPGAFGVRSRDGVVRAFIIVMPDSSRPGGARATVRRS